MVNSLPYGIRFFDLTTDALDALWRKMKGFDPLYSDENRWDEEWFQKRMYDKGTVILELDDGNGVMFLTGLKPGHYAQVHAVFWDHKISSRKSLLKDALLWAFSTFSLLRLEAFIPQFSQVLVRLLRKRLGFTIEGKMRKRMKWHGAFYDVYICSLLREEVVDG